MVKKTNKDNKKTGKKEENRKNEEDEIKSILTTSQNISKAKDIIANLSNEKAQELKAVLKSYETTGYYRLPGKLSDKDINKLLELVKEKESDKKLYKTSELRPTPWSKTVTIFDVYETDEEHFQPYISPLATVGTINSSSSSSETPTDETQLPTETGTEGTSEGFGIGSVLGLGTGGTEQQQGTDEGGLFGWLKGLGK